MELITDRTSADVALGNSKGSYGYADLNRVEQAVANLAVMAKQLDVQLSLSVKTDWGLPGVFNAANWPVQSQMARYLQNVRLLLSAVGVQAVLPESMNALDYLGANQIEKALLVARERILTVKENFRYSGEVYAGEE